MKISLRQVMAAVGLLTASSIGFAQASLSGTVVLYTSNNAQSVDAVKDVARKLMPNVKVNVISGGSGQLLKRMEAESGKPQADIFWTSTANTLGAFKQLYEPYKSPESAAIAPGLLDPSNMWTPANTHIVVAMLNTERLAGAPVPQTWADLADPKFKGKIIIADPENSSTAYTALWLIEQVLGTEGLKKIAANTTVSSAASNVVRAVGQGEYAVGITFESTAYAYVAGGQKGIRIMYPKDGTAVVTDNLVLAKNAPAGALAKRFYDLLLAKETQTALLEAAFRRPSRGDIDVKKFVDMPPMSDVKALPTDEVKAAAERGAFLARWKSYVTAARNAG
jgi:iron(III) transport system substrate-binding protein